MNSGVIIPKKVSISFCHDAKYKRGTNCLFLLDKKKNGRVVPFRWSNTLSSLKTDTQKEKRKRDYNKVMRPVRAMAVQRIKKNRKIIICNGNINTSERSILESQEYNGGCQCKAFNFWFSLHVPK